MPRGFRQSGNDLTGAQISKGGDRLGYFASLIAVSAAAGLACLLVPDEAAPSGRMIRLISSLAVIAVALSPLASAREKVTDLIADLGNYVSSFGGASNDALGESAARAFSAQIAALVCEKFDLPPKRVKVAVTVNTEDGVPALIRSRVSVTAGDGTPDPGEVAAFVEEHTNAECETVILAPG